MFITQMMRSQPTLRAAYPSSRVTFGFGSNFLRFSRRSVDPTNVRSARKMPLSWTSCRLRPRFQGSPTRLVYRGATVANLRFLRPFLSALQPRWPRHVLDTYGSSGCGRSAKLLAQSTRFRPSETSRAGELNRDSVIAGGACGPAGEDDSLASLRPPAVCPNLLFY